MQKGLGAQGPSSHRTSVNTERDLGGGRAGRKLLRGWAPLSPRQLCGGKRRPSCPRACHVLRALPAQPAASTGGGGLVAQACEELNSRFGTKGRLGRAETRHCQGGLRVGRDKAMDLNPQP